MATKDPIARGLSSFFKEAAEAFDEVKDTVLAGGQATKATVDIQLLKRSREKALARLGEVLLDEVARGAAVPASCEAVVKEIKDLDAQLATAKAESEKLWKQAEGKPAQKADAKAAPKPDDDADDE
jgi:hypothetical protein